MRLKNLLIHNWPPLTALLSLVIMVSLTPAIDLDPLHQTVLEVLSHHLGHEINSIWIGIGLLLLVVPSLRAIRRGVNDMWAWRALDAGLDDFLVVDGLCRRFFPWPRPGLLFRHGFPSGHAVFAFMMAWLIWKRYPRLGPLWFAMAAVVGWSRIEVHAHYPYQVFAGALFGCALAALVIHRRAGVLLPRILMRDSTLLQHLKLRPAAGGRLLHIDHGVQGTL